PAIGPITRLERRLPSTYTDSSDAAAASSYPSPSVRYGYPHTRETTVPAVIVPWCSQNPNRVSRWAQATRIVPVGRVGRVTPAAVVAAVRSGSLREPLALADPSSSPVSVRNGAATAGRSSSSA